MVMIEQYQTDLASVVTQSRSLGKEITIICNGEVLTLAQNRNACTKD